MSSDDRLARLRRLPVFADLDDNVLERVLAVSTELESPTGHVFIRADDPGAGMLVPESARVARVRATSPVRCVAISRAAFEELIEGEPAFTLAMLRVVARRL